jgi:uncharacterized membrane protein YgcG
VLYTTYIFVSSCMMISLRVTMTNRLSVFTCKLCGSQILDYSTICRNCRTYFTYKTRLKEIRGLKLLSCSTSSSASTSSGHFATANTSPRGPNTASNGVAGSLPNGAESTSSSSSGGAQSSCSSSSSFVNTGGSFASSSSVSQTGRCP